MNHGPALSRRTATGGCGDVPTQCCKGSRAFSVRPDASQTVGTRLAVRAAIQNSMTPPTWSGSFYPVAGLTESGWDRGSRPPCRKTR